MTKLTAAQKIALDSFQQRPGCFTGRVLPRTIKSLQRRGLSSGPYLTARGEAYIASNSCYCCDRLATGTNTHHDHGTRPACVRHAG